MKPLRIFSDSPSSNSALRLLREGTAGHELVFPDVPAASVLRKSASDPGLAEADIAFGQPDTADVLRTSRLRWLHLSSAGYTRYDTSEFRTAAQARGLVVTNSSTVYAEPCAEHVFAFMLANARGLPRALGTTCENGSATWYQLRSAGRLLRHQSAVILGFGAIAARLIEMLRPFEMPIVAVRRKARGDEGIPIISVADLPAALATADHVINILPDNRESARFVSAERISAMKPGAILYNIGRGATVDQDALLEALRSGRLGAAWLDVTDPEPLPLNHPLLSAPNCFLTPHIGGGQQNEAEALVRHFVANFRRFLDGAPLSDRVI